MDINSRLDVVFMLSSVNLPGTEGELIRRLVEDELMRGILPEVQNIYGSLSLHTSLIYGYEASGKYTWGLKPGTSRLPQVLAPGFINQDQLQNIDSGNLKRQLITFQKLVIW